MSETREEIAWCFASNVIKCNEYQEKWHISKKQISEKGGLVTVWIASRK